MNVATIQEDRVIARQKYAEYLRSVKERHSQEHEILKNAYRELSRGRQVINIYDAMRHAGVDHLYRPKLAVVRADSKLCWFWWDNDIPVFSAKDNYQRRSDSPLVRMRMKRDTFPLPAENVRPRRWQSLRAVVPSIPPNLLPAGKLWRYHILWEAEWEQIPPVDPLLLRSLGKGLFVVLAAWNLTPLERAVLHG